MILNLLRRRGPLTTQELWGVASERYPGVISTKNFMKKTVLRHDLRNKLIKVRVSGSKHRDRWAMRKPGQIRMRVARVKKTSGRGRRRPTGPAKDLGVFAELGNRFQKASVAEGAGAAA